MLLSRVQHLTDFGVEVALRPPRLSPWGAAHPPRSRRKAGGLAARNVLPLKQLSQPPDIALARPCPQLLLPARLTKKCGFRSRMSACLPQRPGFASEDDDDGVPRANERAAAVCAPAAECPVKVPAVRNRPKPPRLRGWSPAEHHRRPLRERGEACGSRSPPLPLGGLLPRTWASEHRAPGAGWLPPWTRAPHGGPDGGEDCPCLAAPPSASSRSPPVFPADVFGGVRLRLPSPREAHPSLPGAGEGALRCRFRDSHQSRNILGADGSAKPLAEAAHVLAAGCGGGGGSAAPDGLSRAAFRGQLPPGGALAARGC